ncbi:hypothetical protein MMC28_001109 [Mycoblastus sanguinarius]|nr:hypothetical protein [Mycoblastus sanguinarius]
MTAQEYFSQVDSFQQYHVDIKEEEDSLDNQGDLDDAADEDMSDSSVDEAFEEIDSLGAEESVADDWNDSDDDISDSLSED